MSIPVEFTGMSTFEQSVAIAWAQAHLSNYMAANPNCSSAQKSDVFLNALEGGLYLLPELRKRFSE